MQAEQIESTNDTDLLTSAATADWLGINPGTLEHWRRAGRGPRWFRMGPRSIRYQRSAVAEWIDAQAKPSGEAPA